MKSKMLVLGATFAVFDPVASQLRRWFSLSYQPAGIIVGHRYEAAFRRSKAMGLIVLLIILLLLFGGGGFYYGPPYHYYGGGLGLVLLIVIVVLLFRGRA
jgi:hypothetical protein